MATTRVGMVNAAPQQFKRDHAKQSYRSDIFTLEEYVFTQIGSIPENTFAGWSWKDNEDAA